MKLLTFLIIILSSTSSSACYITPEEQLLTAPELLAKSTDVSLAQVVRAESGDRGKVTYFFEVRRRFSGEHRKTFKLTGLPAIWEGNNRTFSHHADAHFWTRQGGRNANDADCRIHPNFSVGGTYLVFLGQPYTRKSFELIIRTHGNAATRDKWLHYVEQYFNPTDRQP